MFSRAIFAIFSRAPLFAKALLRAFVPLFRCFRCFHFIDAIFFAEILTSDTLMMIDADRHYADAIRSGRRGDVIATLLRRRMIIDISSLRCRRFLELHCYAITLRAAVIGQDTPHIDIAESLISYGCRRYYDLISAFDYRIEMNGDTAIIDFRP